MCSAPNLNIEVTYDSFLGGKLEIMQAKNGPRAGVDSVLLAASVQAKPQQKVLEAGIGSGVVSLCLAGRIGPLKVTGVDIQPDLAQLARENALHNNFLDDFHVIEGDVTGSGNSWRAMGLEPDSFDHSFANPPFYDIGQVRHPHDPVKAQAHTFDINELERWVKFLVAHTKPKGSITIVHTPEILGKLLSFFDRRVGNVNIFPIYSKEGQAASRMLVQGIKASKGPINIQPGLIMHDSCGKFTKKIATVLRDGASLFND